MSWVGLFMKSHFIFSPLPLSSTPEIIRIKVCWLNTLVVSLMVLFSRCFNVLRCWCMSSLGTCLLVWFKLHSVSLFVILYFWKKQCSLFFCENASNILMLFANISHQVIKIDMLCAMLAYQYCIACLLCFLMWNRNTLNNLIISKENKIWYSLRVILLVTDLVLRPILLVDLVQVCTKSVTRLVLNERQVIWVGGSKQIWDVFCVSVSFFNSWVAWLEQHVPPPKSRTKYLIGLRKPYF